jgi:hypothetical protein
MKLHDELKMLELNSRNALLQKDDLIGDLNNEINIKNHTVNLIFFTCLPKLSNLISYSFKDW